jgi:hypothetical protein
VRFWRERLGLRLYFDRIGPVDASGGSFSPAAVMFLFDGVSQNWQISRVFFAKRQYR